MRLTLYQPARHGQTKTDHVQRDAHKLRLSNSFIFNLFFLTIVLVVFKLGGSKKQPFWSNSSNTRAQTVFHHYFKSRAA